MDVEISNTIIYVGVIVLVFLYIGGIYNHLVTLRNYYKNALSQVDIQLTRRYELIPNLVETTKAYLTHERETLVGITQARSQAVRAKEAVRHDPADNEAVKNLMVADTALNGQVGQFMALYESYPDLKADVSVAQLVEELSSTENRVTFARQSYNDYVMRYNTYSEKFPNKMIADITGFKTAQLFEVENEEVRKPVRVSFS